MKGPHSGFEWLRAQVASDLLSAHISDFQRLIKTLCFGSQFQFIVAEFNDALYRDELIKRIDLLMTEQELRAARLNVAAENTPDVGAFESQLLDLARNHQVIHVTGAEFWFDDQRWQDFNIRREAIARGVGVRLIFWLNGAQITRLALMAPDFWAWRSGVFSFERAGKPMRDLPELLEPLEVDNRSLTERSRRLAEISDWLAAEPPLEDDLRLPLLEEMGDLLQSFERPKEALEIWQDRLLPVYQSKSNVLAVAQIKSKIANVLFHLGRSTDALAMLQTEVRPVLSALGNVVAATKAGITIAKILGYLGKTDQALTLLQDDVLKMARQLESVRLVVDTNFEIANILRRRGELDQCLRILQQDVLTVAEEIGDRRLTARANIRIAWIFVQQGQFEMAQRILREKSLPLLESLGDLSEIVHALFLLAKTHEKLGQIQLAREVYERELLPLANNASPDLLSAIKTAIASLEQIARADISSGVREPKRQKPSKTKRKHSWR